MYIPWCKNLFQSTNRNGVKEYNPSFIPKIIQIHTNSNVNSIGAYLSTEINPAESWKRLWSVRMENYVCQRYKQVQPKWNYVLNDWHSFRWESISSLQF